MPPDTPGMTSAAPMQAPLMVIPRYFISPFISYWILVRNSVADANISLASDLRSSAELLEMIMLNG